VLAQRRPDQLVVFWDVDAPATLERVEQNAADPFAALIPRYDMILTYGGGEPVVDRYRALGARNCTPIYNGVDPTTHCPVPASVDFESNLSLLANRLPDRETRADEFFFAVAERQPRRRFLLGGSGWEQKPRPANVKYVGHVFTGDHNVFNASAGAVLNVSRDSMARNGYSPATRLFEAAGAGACIITDAWAGIERFFEPDREILVAADGGDVAELCALDPGVRSAIGAAARRRVLAHHTYAARALDIERALGVSSAAAIA
jgi:spore maturation protein CgeB